MMRDSLKILSVTSVLTICVAPFFAGDSASARELEFRRKSTDDGRRLETKHLDLGSPAPAITATDSEGNEITLESFDDAAVIVVVFTCNSCPVAMAYEPRFIEFNKQYDAERVAFIAINNSSREDAEANKRRVAEQSINYTYAYEGTGQSARDYGAQVTPHCFVLDQDRTLVYKGAFDDNWNGEPTVEYVSEVVDALLNGRTCEHTETHPVGCAIKLRR